MASPCCCCLDLELEDNALTLDVGGASLEWGEDEYVRVVNANAEEYAGPYEATPTAYEQSMPTSGKTMTMNVTIHKVPYAETTNESGGYTVSILS